MCEKVFLFGVFLVRIFPYLGSISPYSVQMREIWTRKTPNTDTFYAVCAVSQANHFRPVSGPVSGLF